MPKIAVSGKGGVGKTTLVSLLAYVYAERRAQVFAIDADPGANLALALGFPQELSAKIVPIVEMEDLILERARPDIINEIHQLKRDLLTLRWVNACVRLADSTRPQSVSSKCCDNWILL